KPTDRSPWALLSLQFHIPVRAIEERLPGLVFRLRELQIQHRAPLRLFGPANERHMRLARRATTLPHVALQTRADDVIPGGYAPLAPRHDVVQAQFGGRKTLAAVLALVVVAREDVAPVEFHRLLGQLVVFQKADDARHLDLAVDRADPII